MSHLFAFESYHIEHILLSNTQHCVLMRSLALTDFYTEWGFPMNAVMYIRIDGLFLLLRNRAKSKKKFSQKMNILLLLHICVP